MLNGSDANFDAPLKMLPVKLLLAVNFVGTCSTVMIRKALLDRVGHFNVTYKQSEDFELWLRLGCHAQFILLKESLVDKKIHSSNLTNNLKESYSFHLKVLADIRDSLGEYIRNNALKTDYQQDISRTHYKLGELYFNDGSAGDAFHHYWMGLSSCWSLSNLGRYLTVMFKKILRSASFGLLSRKTFEKRLPGEVKNAG